MTLLGQAAAVKVKVLHLSLELMRLLLLGTNYLLDLFLRFIVALLVQVYSPH
jgi:hypothetical protein